MPSLAYLSPRFLTLDTFWAEVEFSIFEFMDWASRTFGKDPLKRLGMWVAKVLNFAQAGCLCDLPRLPWVLLPTSSNIYQPKYSSIVACRWQQGIYFVLLPMRCCSTTSPFMGTTRYEPLKQKWSNLDVARSHPKEIVASLRWGRWGKHSAWRVGDFLRQSGIFWPIRTNLQPLGRPRTPQVLRCSWLPVFVCCGSLSYAAFVQMSI